MDGRCVQSTLLTACTEKGTHLVFVLTFLRHNGRRIEGLQRILSPRKRGAAAGGTRRRKSQKMGSRGEKKLVLAHSENMCQVRN